MSKIIYVCSRNNTFTKDIEKKLTKICDELVPDNVRKPLKHKINVKGHVAYAVTMNSSTLHENDLSLLLGVLYEREDTNWDKPKSRYPDGNYALFRNDQHGIEVVSDAAGSRTIWFYSDEELFIASTSQRAIILFLGTFLFDERIIPWILSTGSLGPQLSWDKRLKRLPADSSALLNKKTWDISVNQSPVSFLQQKRTQIEHRDLLSEAIRKTIRTLEGLDFSEWVLPLSGGYDSRAILCFFKEQMGLPQDLKAVTWGLETAVNESGNDAKIARDLAQSLGIKHKYYHTDVSAEPLETIIDRFILCGEGRIDHLSGYMDGMEIWRKFYDDDISGVIRGDEGFGWNKVSSELTVKISVDCALCSDFNNLKNIIKDYELSSQKLPEEYKRRENETLSEWRDRLYHSYRIPTILSALSDIKFSYVEQINPLLSKAVLDVVRTIPDKLRTEKALFRKIVNMIGPDISFASKGANEKPENILRSESFVNLLKKELSSLDASELLGESFIKHIHDGIKVDNSRPETKVKKLKRSVSLIVPRFVKNWLRDNALSPSVDSNVLAFRVIILLKMHKLLKADATKFANSKALH